MWSCWNFLPLTLLQQGISTCPLLCLASKYSSFKLSLALGQNNSEVEERRLEIPCLLGEEGNISLQSWFKKMAICFQLLRGLKFRNSPARDVFLGRGQVRSSLETCICFSPFWSWCINDVSYRETQIPCQHELRNLEFTANAYFVPFQTSRTRKHGNKVLFSSAF